MGRIGGHANKRLGQHFLIDDQVLRAIVEAAGVTTGDHVLEIGPGLGVLTESLVGAGASVTAIEQDRRFVEWLSDAPLIRGVGGVSVIHGDAARVDWTPLIGDGSWKFISNLPYSITSLALRKALTAVRPPDAIVVLIQKEVAERAIAKDGKMSLLSLMVALYASEFSIVKRVAPGAFYPAPKVDSAVLFIKPLTREALQEKWGIDPERVMALAKKGFAHPRKFLASNLGIEQAKLEAIGLDGRVRAEDVAVQQWVVLAKQS